MSRELNVGYNRNLGKQTIYCRQILQDYSDGGSNWVDTELLLN